MEEKHSKDTVKGKMKKINKNLSIGTSMLLKKLRLLLMRVVRWLLHPGREQKCWVASLKDTSASGGTREMFYRSSNVQH